MRISCKAVAPPKRNYVYKKGKSVRPFNARQSPDRSVAKTNIRFQRFDNLTFGKILILTVGVIIDVVISFFLVLKSQVFFSFAT